MTEEPFTQEGAEKWLHDNLERAILDSFSGASTPVRNDAEGEALVIDITVAALDAAIGSVRGKSWFSKAFFDFSTIDLVLDVRDETRNFRLSPLFSAPIRPESVVRIVGYDAASSSVTFEFMDPVKLISFTLAIDRGPKRRKARRRFRVEAVRRRNGWKRHIRKRWKK